ncbi:hypothetical protein RYZ27_11985 [Hyphomonas sp. FCG-A18]|jgi:hypothetical protein|uniref:hypothetical protein n=1 Tax=Hyphomonas sp. FCG-A18 TaxID=3080019 RepID=UPI002B2BFD0F|nr:hypothetical protein RYZ27_11985 [Hyphomonas sp. FCG-A18]
MTQSSLLNATRDLNDILSQETTLLIEGRLSEIADLNAEKTEAVRAFENALSAADGVGVTAIERREVDATLALARENLQRLSVMRNGLNSLASRLSNLDSGTKVGAYSATGHKLSFDRGTNTLAKKI